MSSRIIDDLPPSHPDGMPWRKACEVCAFRPSNPQELDEGDFQELWLEREFGMVFYCAHRTEDGCVRICACWAAMEKTRLREQLAEAA